MIDLIDNPAKYGDFKVGDTVFFRTDLCNGSDIPLGYSDDMVNKASRANALGGAVIKSFSTIENDDLERVMIYFTEESDKVGLCEWTWGFGMLRKHSQLELIKQMTLD